MIANAPLAVQATKQSALKGLYVDEDAITQVRERRARCAPRSSRSTPPIRHRAGCDRGERRGADQLGKELRTAFEKESRISSAIFQTEDAKEGPKAFAEKRKPVWKAK